MKIERRTIFVNVLIFIFFLVNSVIFGNQYIEFQSDRIQEINDNLSYKKNNKNFKISSINEIKDIELFYTPDEEVLSKILDKINNAKQYIYIEVYMMTEKRIKEALVKAHYRGVDIRILLEKSPYLAYNINNNTFEEFTNKGIKIKWSNTDNYILNHSKFLLIDGISIISTGNITHTTFTKNRDLFIFTYDENINKSLNKIFNNDYEGIKSGSLYENLIISPQNSRSKIVKLLNSAEKNIKIYIPYLNDEKILEEIVKIKKIKNINIEIILSKESINNKFIENLEYIGIGIKFLNKYQMHSKAILVDEKYLFIGSINFSEYSIDKNREIGIIIKEKIIIDRFLEIFESDMIKN